ncbi:hypothetical protein ABPG73_022904 [Tetrahymena malaccensis]
MLRITQTLILIYLSITIHIYTKVTCTSSMIIHLQINQIEESVGLKIKILMSQSGPTKARSKDQNIIENVWGKSNMRLDMMSIIIEMSYGIVFINNGLIFQIILSNLFTKVYLREQSQSYNQIKSQESHTKN